MDIVPIAIVVLGALIFGAILFIPGHYLGKRLLRRSPVGSAARLRITPAGFVYFGSIVVLLMGGFSLQYLASDTTVGQFMATGYGRMIFCFLLIVICAVGEVVLKRIGVHCVVREQTV